MSDEETKSCPNCKREIPIVNFTIHSVHCTRNIKVCPVCKEPVPGPELNDHHQKMHKLLPCKQCGESVCGTDLEDHIRDSCANTVKTCRYCELELARRELQAHEGYCGARTEQCVDCREYVMIKYRQLHIDSNHGFIRLDDDPAPPKKEPPKLNLVRPLSKSNLNRPNPSTSNGLKPDNVQRPTSIFDGFNRQPDRSGLDSPSHANNRQTSELSPITFGNPRPYVRLSPNSEPTLNPGVGSPDPRPSLSNVRPDSSNSGPSPNSKNTSVKTRPNSFDTRTDLNFSSPLPFPSPNSGGLPNYGPGSSYAAADSTNSRLGSSNARPDSNFELASPNARPNASNFEQSSSSARPGSSNFEPSSSNARPGSSNFEQSSSNARPGSSNLESSSSNTRPSNFDIAGNKKILSNTNNIRNITKTELKNQGSNYTGGPASNISPQEPTVLARASNGVKKRTNDQPQINMDTSGTKTVDKDLGAVSRGAVKKRPAPPPPRASARRDLPYYSAMQRQQREERERRDQNEYNLAHGLPPVLNPAQKIEKLRKLDALQNWNYEDEFRSRQRKPSPEPYAPPPQASEGYTLGSYQDADEATRQEFKNLKPMSPHQFMQRFSSLQVSEVRADRFPEIRSSLRELRRGLNEVTAPYNSNNNITPNNNNERVRSGSGGAGEEVRLPCEFCSVLVPADDLVQHQTGCRPDLAQLQPAREADTATCLSPRAPRPPRDPLAPRDPRDPRDPVIPCEFCMQSLPVYLINEHQERCIRENMAD